MSRYTDPASDPELRRKRKLWLPYPVTKPENMPDNPAVAVSSDIVLDTVLPHSYPIRVKYAPDRAAVAFARDEFKETEHKRDEGGKFTSGGGGGGAKPKEAPAVKKPKKPSKALHFSKAGDVPAGVGGKAFSSYEPPDRWSQASGHNQDID